MLTTLIDAARDVEPDLWRHYLRIVLRGMSARPELAPSLEPGPLELDNVDRVMSALRPAGR